MMLHSLECGFYCSSNLTQVQCLSVHRVSNAKFCNIKMWFHTGAKPVCTFVVDTIQACIYLTFVTSNLKTSFNFR